MKNTILLLAMLCISASLWANDHGTEKEISRLTRLLPDNVTRYKVKEILGEATYIDINNKTGEEAWHYKTDDNVDIYFRWNVKDGHLKSFNYNSYKVLKQSWTNQYLSSLEMGSCTLEHAVKAMGDPTGINVRSEEQELKYSYLDNIVELQFSNGLLANIRISLKRK